MKNLEFGKSLSLLHDFIYEFKRTTLNGNMPNDGMTSIYRDANELIHKNHSSLSAYLEYMYGDINEKLPNPLKTTINGYNLPEADWESTT